MTTRRARLRERSTVKRHDAYRYGTPRLRGFLRHHSRRRRVSRVRRRPRRVSLLSLRVRVAKVRLDRLAQRRMFAGDETVVAHVPRAVVVPSLRRRRGRARLRERRSFLRGHRRLRLSGRRGGRGDHRRATHPAEIQTRRDVRARREHLHTRRRRDRAPKIGGRRRENGSEGKRRRRREIKRRVQDDDVRRRLPSRVHSVGSLSIRVSRRVSRLLRAHVDPRANPGPRQRRGARLVVRVAL